MQVTATYYVQGGHTLGTVLNNSKELSPNTYLFEPHRAYVRLGATFRTIDSPYLVNLSELRKATPADFEFFRVAMPSSFNPATSMA